MSAEVNYRGNGRAAQSRLFRPLRRSISLLEHLKCQRRGDDGWGRCESASMIECGQLERSGDLVEIVRMEAYDGNVVGSAQSTIPL